VIRGADLAAAQPTSCPSGALPSPDAISEDACRKTEDLLRYLVPELGMAISGGNPMLGEGGALGAVGRVSVSIRANAVLGSVPRLSQIPVSLTGAVSSQIALESQLIAAPAGDVALGVLPGFAAGVSRILSIDALGSVVYLPPWHGGGARVRFPDGGVNIGYGVRVGLIDESIITPAVGLTYLHRGLPTSDVRADIVSSGNATTLAIRDLTLDSDSWRLVAAKSLVRADIAMGGGRDRYTSRATIQAIVNGTSSSILDTSQRVTRTNLFADVSLIVFAQHVVLEGGVVRGGTVATFNGWSGAQPTDMRAYLALGVRRTLAP
jgi:hypothetical protein